MNIFISVATGEAKGAGAVAPTGPGFNPEIRAFPLKSMNT